MTSDKDFLERLNLLQKQIDAQKIVTTASTGGKTQNRVTGERGVKNPFGHSTRIGVSLDFVVLNGMSGRFTKQEIADFCDTKVSKVNSHYNNELSKKFGLVYNVNKSGRLEFHFPANSAGFEIQKRYLVLTSAPRTTPAERQEIIRKKRI